MGPRPRVELQEVAEALHRLPLKQREVLILIGASGLSYEEAATICGCSIGTIKSRLSRARQAMAVMLEGEGQMLRGFGQEALEEAAALPEPGGKPASSLTET